MITRNNPAESGHTPGDSVTIEAKLKINEDVLMQLTVLSAFVEKNLHEDLCPMVPTVLMAPTTASICIYDVRQDYLIISETFQWLEKDSQNGYTFDKPGFLLLWMALYHR